MISKVLKQQAIETWAEYSEAMRASFRWPVGKGLEMFSIEQVFATNDPEAVEQFIKYYKTAAADVRKMKFVGER